MRCPECAKQKTKVRTAATLTARAAADVRAHRDQRRSRTSRDGAAAGCTGRSAGGVSDYAKGALYGPAVADGDWWRIITSGFLHAGLLHIAFNMYFLYFLGTLLEPAIGKVRFGIIYFVALLGGSVGALLLSPNDVTVGASGAVFGLMGAAILAMRARGIDPMQSGLGVTLLLNLGITFVIPGIAIGGHLGGFAAGFIIGYFMFEVADRRRLAASVVYGVSAVFAVGLAIAAVLVAQSAAPPGF